MIWSALALQTQSAISGDEAIPQSSWLVTHRKIESVAVFDGNKDSQSRVCAALATNPIRYIKALGFILWERNDIAPVDRAIQGCSGELLWIVDPLKATSDRYNPSWTFAKVFKSDRAASVPACVSGLILRSVALKQPRPLAADGNLRLLPHSNEQKSGGNDIGKSQSIQHNVGDSYVGQPSDETLSLAYMLIGALLFLLGILVSYGWGWGYRSLNNWEIAGCIAGGLILLAMGFLVGLFGLSMAQCAYGTHQNPSSEQSAHRSCPFHRTHSCTRFEPSLSFTEFGEIRPRIEIFPVTT